MATYEETMSAKEKFKAEYWSKNQDQYNAILIGADIVWDAALIEQSEEPDFELFDAVQDYHIKAFLFDIEDAFGLPTMIDGVEIRYFGVME